MKTMLPVTPKLCRALLPALWLFARTGLAQDARQDFLALIDRPRVSPAAEVTEMPSTGSLTDFHFTFAAEQHERVPGILVKAPAGATRRPVVIVLHGTGGKKSDELPLLRQLAEKGFIGVAIDGRYHGERSKTGAGSATYQDAIVEAWKTGHGHPFCFDTVWDVMRLVDYLATRDDVDKDRIGLIGFSKGGIETYLTAAVDPRIAVAVPCIGLQSFRWALENNAWKPRVGTIPDAFKAAAKDAGIAEPDADFVRKFYARVVPGIDDKFDGPAMAPLIAPRPLLVINGDSDDKTPLEGLKLCADAAQAAYHADGADDRFLIRIQEHTGHRVNPDSRSAAIDWFVKWLKP
jgi:dienelactone hydrolase